MQTTDVRFLVPASRVTISYPKSLSSSETGVYSGILRSEKRKSTECHEAIGGIYSKKK
jgi:hypothetical protein